MATSAILEIKEVVSWLKSIEQRVGNIYTKASQSFIKDKEFSDFLNQLSKDEDLHAEFMSMVLDNLIKTKNRFLLDIILDDKTRDNVEGLLSKFENLIAKENIIKQQVIEYMVRAESCELNPVFLYIAGTFGQLNRETEYISSEIQSHLARIQNFIERLPLELKPSISLDSFASIWDKRFLVVDDDETLRKLVGSLLSAKGNTEIVSNGREALEKVKEHFYNGIVSDIEMPGMNGIEFYKRAVSYDPRLKKHFLFYSANITTQRQDYFNKNHLQFLRKPFGLSEFQNIIEQFLRQ